MTRLVVTPDVPGSSTFRGLLNLALHSFKFQPAGCAAFAHDHS